MLSAVCLDPETPGALPAVCRAGSIIVDVFQGSPVGIQIAGPNGSDALILEVSHSLEQLLAENDETARPLPDLAKLKASPPVR